MSIQTNIHVNYIPMELFIRYEKEKVPFPTKYDVIIPKNDLVSNLRFQ